MTGGVVRNKSLVSYAVLNIVVTHTHTHTQDEFCEVANRIHPRIQVTKEYSKDSVVFLDTRVKLVNGMIETDLYTKPADQHLYLHSKSDHPSSTKQAIPYGLGIRLRRICLDDKSYSGNRKVLK